MTPSEIKELYDRKARAMARRPAFARGSGYAQVRMGKECVCDVDEGDRALRVDLPIGEGGGGTGSHPGQLMRASIGACLAVGYRLWGARLAVPIDRVEVDVVCEYDARGQMGVLDNVSIGWERIRFDVRITSGASEADVRRVVEVADRLSPMLANLSTAIERTHRLTVIGAPGEGSSHG